MPLLELLQGSDEEMEQDQEAEKDGQAEWIDDNSSEATAARQYRKIPLVNWRKEESISLLKEVWGRHWPKKLGRIGPKQQGASFISHLAEFAKVERDMNNVIPVLKRVVEQRLEKHAHSRLLSYPHLMTRDICQARKQYDQQAAEVKAQQAEKERIQQAEKERIQQTEKENNQRAEEERAQPAAQEKSQQAEKSGRLEVLFQQMDAYNQQMKEAAAALQGTVTLFQGAASSWASMKDLFKDILTEKEKDELEAEASAEIGNGNALQAGGVQVMEVDAVEVNAHEPVEGGNAVIHCNSSRGSGRGRGRGRGWGRGRGRSWGRGRGRGRGIGRGGRGTSLSSRGGLARATSEVNLANQVRASTPTPRLAPATSDHQHNGSQQQEAGGVTKPQSVPGQIKLGGRATSKTAVTQEPPVTGEASSKTQPETSDAQQPNPEPALTASLPHSCGDYYGPFLMSTPSPGSQSSAQPKKPQMARRSRPWGIGWRSGVNRATARIVTSINHLTSINHDSSDENESSQSDLSVLASPSPPPPPLRPSPASSSSSSSPQSPANTDLMITHASLPVARDTPEFIRATNTYPTYSAAQHAPGHLPLTIKKPINVTAEITDYLTAKEALSLLPLQSNHSEIPGVNSREGFSRITISSILGGGVQSTLSTPDQRKTHRYSVPGYICAKRSLNPTLPDQPCKNAVMHVLSPDKTRLGKEFPLFIRHQANQWFYYGTYFLEKYYYLALKGWVTELTEESKKTWSRQITEQQWGRDILRRAGLRESELRDASKARALLEKEDDQHPQIRLLLLLLRPMRWDEKMYDLLVEQKKKEGISRSRINSSIVSKRRRRVYDDPDEEEVDGEENDDGTPPIVVKVEDDSPVAGEKEDMVFSGLLLGQSSGLGKRKRLIKDEV